jgi:DNA-binding beta-propeller fold protein YncE
MLVGVLLAAAVAVIVAATTVTTATVATAQPAAPYEVWTIDQADPGNGGAWLYIYDGRQLEAGGAVTPERVNLFTAAINVGDGPGNRPHMLEFTSRATHAVISNVATGHVYVMRAGERRTVASIDVGEQAHHATPSPDDAYILVANQNGKRLARIRADLAAERFTYNRADDLNLGALESPSQPDNAPICPTVTADKAYVTVRGGGFFVVDYRATPMRIVKAYSKDDIGPAGCGAFAKGDKVYVNSGTALSSDFYVLDRRSDAIIRHMRLSWTGFDSHGMVPVGGGAYIWAGNRVDRNVVVIDAGRHTIAGIITGIGGTPDIMGLAPSGRRVYAALRGPNPLTGGHPATGEKPGMAALDVMDDGRTGRRAAFYPIGDQGPASHADPHALAVRVPQR